MSEEICFDPRIIQDKKIYIISWITTLKQIIEILGKLCSIHPKNTETYNYILDNFGDKYEAWTLEQKNDINNIFLDMMNIHKWSIMKLEYEMVSFRKLLNWTKILTNDDDINSKNAEDIIHIHERIINFADKHRVEKEKNVNEIIKERKKIELNILNKFKSMYNKCERLMFLD